MSNKSSVSRKICFDSEYYEPISAWLASQSISRKSILIPVKARPFTWKATPMMFFRCTLDKGESVSSVRWKSFLSPAEAIAVCIAPLFCAAAWIKSIISMIKKTARVFLTIGNLLLASAVALGVVLYCYYLYRYCSKRFAEMITAKLAAITEGNQGQSGDKHTGTVLLC